MQTPRRSSDRARSDRPVRATGATGGLAVWPPGAGVALPFCLCAAMGAVALHVSAAERDLDAHEHGAATLDIALDGARLYLDLETPAANVLGFEHAPSTDAQRVSVAEADRVLGADGLFVPDAAADCTLEDVTVAIALPGAPDGEDGSAQEHGEEHVDGDAEGHEDEHEEGHGDGDAEGHEEGHEGHDDEQGAVHSDITASHVLLCGNPEALRTLETTLFDRYDGFEDIDVQLVGPGGQDGARLTADSPALSLEPIL